MTPELPAWLVTAGVWVGGFAVIATGLTAICVGLVKLYAAIRRPFKRISHFLDDWAGEEERPGFEGRPGVMERLAGIEDRLGTVEHEVQHNNGGSLKDAVRRTENAVAELTRRDPQPPVVQQDITIRPDPPA